jgi:hypothetical protein
MPWRGCTGAECLARRSKGHWGYPEAWMEAWEPALTLTPAQLTGHYAVLVAADGPPGILWIGARRGWLATGALLGRPVGHERRSDDAWWSMHWLARGLGVSTLSVESDPSAQAFYERLGARHAQCIAPGVWRAPATAGT